MDIISLIIVNFKSNFLFWLSTSLLLLGFINLIIIFPILFKIFVIPKIEARIGENFKYIGPLYGGMVFSTWIAPPADIGGAIVSKYLFWKITGKISRKVSREKILKLRHPKSPFVLMQLHYNITEASTLEIVMSFLSIVNVLFTVLLMILICIF